MKNKLRFVSLRPDQIAYLKEHPQIKFSALVRKWLDRLIEKEANGIESKMAEIFGNNTVVTLSDLLHPPKQRDMNSPPIDHYQCPRCKQIYSPSFQRNYCNDCGLLLKAVPDPRLQ